MDAVLKKANVFMVRRDLLRLKGIGFRELLQHVGDLFRLEADDIITPGKHPQRVAARSLLCYWLVREGEGVTTIAGKLGVIQSTVSKVVERGKQIAEKNNYAFPDRNA